jgi:hypothetical protein
MRLRTKLAVGAGILASVTAVASGSFAIPLLSGSPVAAVLGIGSSSSSHSSQSAHAGTQASPSGGVHVSSPGSTSAGGSGGGSSSADAAGSGESRAPSNGSSSGSGLSATSGLGVADLGGSGDTEPVSSASDDGFTVVASQPAVSVVCDPGAESGVATVKLRAGRDLSESATQAVEQFKLSWDGGSMIVGADGFSSTGDHIRVPCPDQAPAPAPASSGSEAEPTSAEPGSASPEPTSAQPESAPAEPDAAPSASGVLHLVLQPLVHGQVLSGTSLNLSLGLHIVLSAS